MNRNSQSRIVITNVSPELEQGQYSIKQCIGDTVTVEADIFTDGHTRIIALLLFQKAHAKDWSTVEMQHIGNDRWKASFTVDTLGNYFYQLQAHLDYFGTWQDDIQKKKLHNIDITKDLQVGIEIIKQALDHGKNPTLLKIYNALTLSKNGEKTFLLAVHSDLHVLMKAHYIHKQPDKKYEKTLSIIVDPVLARCSAWYEFFPRSCSSKPYTHGTFKDCALWLSKIATMGFDIVYLPPIHPIGTSFRKGKNNSLQASNKDPGSPWAIGGKEGGHTAVNPLLGTEEEFEELIETAKSFNMQIAMDIAFQCSPDHPYLKEHPEWFSYLPDGTVQHAENPPKKYEDIVPFYFETAHHQELWEELLNIVLYWINKGIRCFRVDNPHTKPFAFWHWLINSVKEQYPEVIFLSEAFTRPKVMHWLAKIGFSQSYTYFTWRYTKNELTQYIQESTTSNVAAYFRPNFWPNTPDILPFDLQYYGKPAFMSRLILAATLSSNYGVYGPPFEQMLHDAIDGTEEYIHAEKYEITFWDKNHSQIITDLMTKLNTIRRKHRALQKTDNIQFHETNNTQVICYSKSGPELLIIIVSFDPHTRQSAKITIPYSSEGSYRVCELLENQYSIWEGTTVEVHIDPKTMPARIYKILPPLDREEKFDYFM